MKRIRLIMAVSITALFVLCLSLHYSVQSKAQKIYRNNALANLSQFGMEFTINPETDSLASIFGNSVMEGEIKTCGFEEINTKRAKELRLTMKLNLTSAAYLHRNLKSNESLDAFLARKGSSLMTWNMHSNFWKMVENARKQNVHIDCFPILWEKDASLYEGQVIYLNWDGSKRIQSESEFKICLEHASRWLIDEQKRTP